MVDENASDAVVEDVGQSGWSELLTREDYWSIWLGLLLIVIGLAIYLPRAPQGMDETIASANAAMQSEGAKAPFRTVEWYEAQDRKKALKGTSGAHGKTATRFLAKPRGWKSNPIDALFLGDDEATALKEAATARYGAARQRTGDALETARAAQTQAAWAAYGDAALNAAAQQSIEDWRAARAAESKAGKKAKVSGFLQIPHLIGLCLFLGILFGLGTHFMGGSPSRFLLGFLFVFALAVLAYMASSQALMKQYGIGYAAWAILFGMLISNTVGTPGWVMPAVKTEYFIKTGLVLLGAEILFGKIVTIGLPGIFVAWIVTPIVLVTTYIFGQKIVKIPSKTLNITISADMSVCGVSAAIATAAACKAKKEELTLAVGLSLIFTSIMMILMPLFIKAVDMPFILGGAWMGGTIDATGAVAAAGAFLSDKALYVAATIKMIQNVLIGIVAFFVALYWALKVERQPGMKVSKWEVWYRFPKFVLGFIGVSIAFSILYEALGTDAGYTLVDQGVIRGWTKLFRGWCFCLAFVSIGLATNFRELAHYFRGGKPLILYVCGQSFNLCLTLLMAWIMFFKVFPEIMAKI